MMEKQYTTAQWEQCKPMNVEFTKFCYHTTGQVSSVHGVVKIYKKSKHVYTLETRGATWDALGHCTLKNRGRVRNYDIDFKEVSYDKDRRTV